MIGLMRESLLQKVPLAITVFVVIAMTSTIHTQTAEAFPQERVTVITNGQDFAKGEPVAIFIQGTIPESTNVTVDNFQSEYPIAEGPCGITYMNFAFLRGAHPNISSYDDLLKLKDYALNVKYPAAKGYVSCMIQSAGIDSAELSPSVTKDIPPEELANVDSRTLTKIFGDSKPSVTYSQAKVTYKLEGYAEETKTIEYSLVDFYKGITQYYDEEVTREAISSDETRVFRASHELEPGQYTIVGFTMSGAVSEPIVITISSQDKVPTPLLLGGLQRLADYANLGIGFMLAGAGFVAFAMYARRAGIGSWRNFGGSMPKFSIVILMTLMLASGAYVSTFPAAYAAWDKGAQGIKVSGTSSSFNIAAAQTDLMGWRTTGTSDGTGASSQLNTYLSGQTTGTSYLWAQSVISFRASSSTYNSYTCNTWPSGSMTCDYVNAITLTPRTEFHTGKGLFGCNDGSAGWGFWINDDLDCYHSNPPLNQLIEYSRNIGASGYKRFNLYEYMTLSSDGKINSVTKLSRCTTQTSCGGYEQFFSYTSPTMTSSNQKFTSGSVGGTTYYPNAVFVGHSGGAVYTGKTGTYFEQTFDVSDSSTGSASYSKCTSSNVCNSPAEGNQDICWNTTIGDTGTARNFKSSAKYSTSCHSGSP